MLEVVECLAVCAWMLVPVALEVWECATGRGANNGLCNHGGKAE